MSVHGGHGTGHGRGRGVDDVPLPPTPDDNGTNDDDVDADPTSTWSDYGHHGSCSKSTTTHHVPHDKCSEFLKCHPPTSSHASDLMQAKDWLHTGGVRVIDGQMQRQGDGTLWITIATRLGS